MLCMATRHLCTSHYAWLAVYYCQLRRVDSFNELSPGLRVSALAAAVGRDYPARAREILEWNGTTRSAMLGVLDDLTTHKQIAREVMLWSASRSSDTLECVAVYLPQGIDLRVLTNGQTLRTLLLTENNLAGHQSASWRLEFSALGWVVD